MQELSNTNSLVELSHHLHRGRKRSLLNWSWPRPRKQRVGPVWGDFVPFLLPVQRDWKGPVPTCSIPSWVTVSSPRPLSPLACYVTPTKGWNPSSSWKKTWNLNTELRLDEWPLHWNWVVTWGVIILSVQILNNVLAWLLPLQILAQQQDFQDSSRDILSTGIPQTAVSKKYCLQRGLVYLKSDGQDLRKNVPGWQSF